MLEFKRSEGKSMDEWLAMDDFKQFLINSAVGEVPVFFLDGEAGGLLFLSSLFLPQPLFQEEFLEELINWQENPVEGGWSYDGGFYDGEEYTEIYPPYSSMDPEILKNAIPILTRRTNILNKDQPFYYEVNPEISHIHDLHWSEDHQAYCTLDENGDIWDVVKIHQEGRRTLVTISERILYKHMILGDYLLLRFFDLDRWEGELPTPESKDYESMVYWHDHDIHARWTPVQCSNGSLGRVFLRGIQVLPPPSDHEIRRELIEGKAKHYCTYIAMDWKHGKIGEFSCDPDLLGNYFEESDYPFETSPAFFKREVLRKYQSDSEKYTIEDRRIECRSSWSLSYDVNPEDQVHIYLIDLANLPLVEQFHWKSYNEPPKSGISRRAYRTDFLAEWDTDPEPLRDLERLLDSFPQATGPDGYNEIWQPPTGADAHLADQVHYPTSDSRQEWETEIGELDKLVVEGLNLRYLRRVALSLGIEHERLASILLLREVLAAKGLAPDLVANIIDPLRELQNLRTKFVGHRGGSDADEIARDLRRRHKGFDNHFRDLVVRLYEGLSILADLVQKGYLNLP